MLSGVGPPVAIIGISGNSFLIFETMEAVLAPPDTLNMDTPAFIRAAISSFSDTTVITIGISIRFFISIIRAFGVGALSTTPKAPFSSA